MTVTQATMRTRTIQLPGGKHLRATLIDGVPNSESVLALSRSFDQGPGSLLEPEAAHLVVPAEYLEALIGALEELLETHEEGAQGG